MDRVLICSQTFVANENNKDTDKVSAEYHNRALAVCNRLAFLASSGTVDEFIERYAVLQKLCKHWVLGHRQVRVVCCCSVGSEFDESGTDDEQMEMTPNSRSLPAGNNVNEDLMSFESPPAANVMNTSGQLISKIKITPSSGAKVCRSCGVSFRTRAQLKRHQNSEHPPCAGSDDHPDSTENSQTESIELSSESRLAENAMMDAFRKRPPKCTLKKRSLVHCEICDYHCSSSKSLESHHRSCHGLHAESRQNSCDEDHADGSSSSVGSPAAQDDVVSGSPPETPRFMCSVCGRRFRLRQLLAAHTVTHTGERPFACRFPGCTKRFGQTSTRNYHERTHSDARPYVCSQCGQCYKQPSYLKIHMVIMHSSDARPHRCQQCDKAFKVPRALLLHTRNAHSDERSQQCDLCPKRFKNRQQLQRHKRALHSKERPWRCTVCERTFTQPGNLRTHMRTHTGEKPYACSVCGTRFAHSGTLKGHMSTHRKATGKSDP